MATISILGPQSGQETLRCESSKDGHGVFWKSTARDRRDTRVSEESRVANIFKVTWHLRKPLEA